MVAETRDKCLDTLTVLLSEMGCSNRSNKFDKECNDKQCSHGVSSDAGAREVKERKRRTLVFRKWIAMGIVVVKDWRQSTRLGPKEALGRRGHGRCKVCNECSVGTGRTLKAGAGGPAKSWLGALCWSG